MIFTRDELKNILIDNEDIVIEELYKKSRDISHLYYSDKIYIRGLIEFTNYCKNDCYYCGIRCKNEKVFRYRMREDEILDTCKKAYDNGFRTFVLQGGEDGYFSDSVIVKLIDKIKEKFSDVAVTLSIGEKSKESYKAFFNAGADRYLLRHETINQGHYNKLHPLELSLKNRLRCLYDLKEIGFQTGCGFMVGSPYQSIDDLIEELVFLDEFKPEMVGIGPFMPHEESRFKDFQKGSVNMTLKLISLIRIILPSVLLPATTALGSAEKGGRERGILAGANVIMPNITPAKYRKDYNLYNNKDSLYVETIENLQTVKNNINEIGYKIVVDRGDAYNIYSDKDKIVWQRKEK